MIQFRNVSKTFKRNRVLDGIGLDIGLGERVALIGSNGAGKTTLIRLILGGTAPDAGSVRLGTKLAAAYFDQFRAALDEEATLAEVISPGSDYVQLDGEKKHVISYLEDFLFPAARARAPVKSLSGGERARLLLARLFAKPANVIVLDEPTNDLDMETLELLEQLLQEYDGTVLLVSHDRSFLDNIVTQVIAAEGEGRWRETVGGYEDWQRETRPRQAQQAAASPATEKREAVERKRESRQKAKLSFKEARELETLPDRIAALETEQSDLNARLVDPALYRGAPEEVRSLRERLAALDLEITQAMQRWEELESRAATG